MYRLVLVTLLALFGSVIALTDVNRECIAENSDLFSNDNLIGVWYRIWKFTVMGAMVPSSSCADRTFSRPSAAVIQEYKDYYSNPSLPYNIDDNPVQIKIGNSLDGMLVGNTVAKFIVVNPNSSCFSADCYTVDAYRPLSPKYIMYTECSLRGFTRWLLTTDRHAPVAEMQELIRNTPELNSMDGQRFCDTY